MPVLKHYQGNCHVYVDARCDLDMAIRIILNSKVERPGVCNAAETLLVHHAIAPIFLPRAADALMRAGVELRGDPVARKIVSTLHHAGVPLLAGTDTPMPNVYPGYSLHDELALLVASGLSPAEALRAATLAPATFLGVADSSVSIAVGKRADLVLLDANPLTDIRNTRRIRAVVLNGRALPRSALDAMLVEAAKEAAAAPSH